MALAVAGGDILQRFCPACGVEVEVAFFTAGSGVASEEVARCTYCGFTFTDASAPLPSSGCLFESVALAEDTATVRTAVREVLVEHHLAAQVHEFMDGAQVVRAFGVPPGSPAPFDLAILDLNMPVMDGLKAAAFIRALERQRGWGSTPILFFSSVQCDDRLRQQFTQLKPAIYVNKGTIRDREGLVERLTAVLGRIKEWSLAGTGWRGA